MDKVLIVYEESDKLTTAVEMVEEEFQNKKYETEAYFLKDEEGRRIVRDILRKNDISYVCTFNMAGFEIGTIAGSVAYNVSTAKQMHIIVDEDVIERYAEGEFALNLFFFVADEAKKWQQQYPNILNVEEYSPFEMDNNGEVKNSESNRREVSRMIDRLIEEAVGQERRGIAT